MPTTVLIKLTHPIWRRSPPSLYPRRSPPSLYPRSVIPPLVATRIIVRRLSHGNCPDIVRSSVGKPGLWTMVPKRRARGHYRQRLLTLVIYLWCCISSLDMLWTYTPNVVKICTSYCKVFLCIWYKFVFFPISYVACMITNCNKLVWFLLRNYTPNVARLFWTFAMCFQKKKGMLLFAFKNATNTLFFVVILYDLCCNNWWFCCKWISIIKLLLNLCYYIHMFFCCNRLWFLFE